jgi:hypothetical protein
MERLARNQAVYREVNQRITELVDEPASQKIDFLCECSNESCAETVALTLAEFQQVRGDPTTFAIVPGHETPAIEKVVTTHSGYLVVEKTNGREAVTAMVRPQTAA